VHRGQHRRQFVDSRTDALMSKSGSKRFIDGVYRRDHHDHGADMKIPRARGSTTGRTGRRCSHYVLRYLYGALVL